MDVGTLASGAVSLLVPYLVKAGKTISNKIGEDTGNMVDKKIETIYEGIKKKFIGKDYASQTIKRLEEKPEDEDRQNAMKGVLKEVLTEDIQFQKMLIQLLAEAKKEGGGNIIKIHESGAIATGGSEINIKGKYASGRDIKFDRPPFL